MCDKEFSQQLPFRIRHDGEQPSTCPSAKMPPGYKAALGMIFTGILLLGFGLVAGFGIPGWFKGSFSNGVNR